MLAEPAADFAAPDALFCDTCGANLALAPFHPGHRGLIGTGRLHAPAGAPLDTERKQVTVLFGDIAGSTQLIAGRDPEEARALLDPVIQVMMDAVQSYGGTVNQIQGDGIMALFGAPISHEDHALRASYAALSMHASIARLSSDPRYRETPVCVHVGIATGEALVGTIGSDISKGYNAVGETIHVASRLQHIARPGGTLVTAATAGLAEGFIQTASVGSTAIRGLTEPVAVFELLGARSTRMRFHATAARGLTPFLGRGREFTELRRALKRAQHGAGEAVALVGDAGIGKSRLVWELTRSPLAAGCRILEAGCVSYGRDIPYLPVIGLLTSFFQVAEGEDARETARKVAAKIAALGLDPNTLRAPLLALLDHDPQDATWRALDPLHRRDAINAALLELVRRQSDTAPLILVVEDLHWVDSETAAFLDTLVAALPLARVLLVVNYRGEYEPGWSRRPHVTRLAVAPLSGRAVRRLVATMLGGPATQERLAEELVERTAGNPFFLEESVRTLIEAKVLVGEPGALQLVQSGSALHVPSSVRAVLAARIDRLSPPDKRLLQAAAAIGHRFSVVLLRRLLGEETQDLLQEQLARLKDAGLIYESSLFPELTYSFMHALTQEVAYDSLLQDRRRRLHADILQSIETVHAARLSEHVETLAHHAARGEAWDRLAQYGRQAGQKAAARSAYREAAVHFEQACNAYTRLPRTPGRLAEAIDTRFDLRNALFPLGEVERDLDHLRQAEALAGELRDGRRLAWAAAYMARDLALLGQPDRALQGGLRALTLAEEARDDDLAVLTRCYIGQAHYALGQYRQSAAVMQRLVEATANGDVHRRFGLPGTGAVFFRAWLAWARARMGDATDLAARMQEMLAAAAAAGQPLSLAVAQYSHGFSLLHQGEHERAIVVLERGAQLCRRWSFAAWAANIGCSLGHAYVQAGRVEQGLDLLWQAVRQTRVIGITAGHAAELAWLAEACLAAGRPVDAAEHARAALGLARRFKERGNEAAALYVCGEVALRSGGDAATASGYFVTALSRAEACEMRPLILRCRKGLERLRRRRSRRPAGLPVRGVPAVAARAARPM